MAVDDSPEPAGRAAAWRLVAVFGLLSFLQGVIEPTEGLLAQPIRSRLMGWSRGAGEIGGFAAILSIPWALKPLLGVLTDVLPLWGSRRRGYLVAAGAVSALAFLALAVVPGAGGSPTGLMAGLFVASAAVAMSDVATDALAVDRGQADGRTGRYQSAQWFCLYASGIVTGTLGGVLSAGGQARAALLACALASVLMLAVAAVGAREPPVARGRRVAGGLRHAAGSPGVWAVVGFLGVGNFNPFASGGLLQIHMTGVLGFSERFFGETISILAAASMAAAAVYGVLGRRVPLRVLAYASVALGVVGNLAYAGVSGHRSAVVVTLVVGFTSMTATLIQFELAARACPPLAAGTVFAAFMAVCNLSAALATWLGGAWYETAGSSRVRLAAFQSLVLAGSAFTALGALLVPFLPVDRIGPVNEDTTRITDDR